MPAEIDPQVDPNDPNANPDDGGGNPDDGGGNPTPTPASGGGRTVTVPTSSMGRIRRQEFEKGKAAGFAELATQAGFESPEELTQALAKLRQPAPTQPAPRPAAPARAARPAEGEGNTPDPDLARVRDDRRQISRYERQLEKATNERNRHAQRAADFERQATESKAEAESLRAEMVLRTMAAQAGIKDIDYAVHLINKRVEEMPEADVEKFDEKAFFEGLRTSHPLLYGEEVRPANTGTGTGTRPGAPTPANVARTNGANGKVNVKDMNPQQFAEHLQKRGISSVGSSS